MAQQQDQDTYGVQDPNDLLSEQQASYAQEMARAPNTMSRSIISGIGGLQNANGGGPQMQTAQAVQSRMRDIMNDINRTAPDNEDPLSKQMRLSQAMATGLADISPKAAMAANEQAVKLQQGKQQQRILDSRAALEDVQTQEGQVSLQQKKAAANYVVYDSTTGDDKMPELRAYGSPISMYKADGSLDPDFNTNMMQAVQDAKDKGATNPMYTTSDSFTNGKAAVADARARAQVAAASLRTQQLAASRTGSTDPDVIRMNAGDYMLHGMQALARLPPEERDATRAFVAAHGLSPLDGVMAQTEIKGVNAAAGSAERRAGNIAVLAQSIPQLGKNVLDTLDDVDRTRFPLINKGIILGRDMTGSAEERKYSAAIQGFVNDYARVIAGGLGITSDAARDQAHELLSRADSPEAVRGVVNFLKDKEVKAISEAGPAALELLARPQSYPHATKIMEALGFDQLGIDARVNALPTAPGSADNPVIPPAIVPQTVKVY